MSNTMIRILTVRTAATDWDEAGRIHGRADLPISEAGRAAFVSELEGLGLMEISCIQHAPDETSLETAELLAEACEAKRVSSPGLSEFDAGLWEGTLTSELEDRYPRVFRQWQTDPLGVSPPEGEALADAQARVIGQVRKIIGKARAGQGVALVLKPMALGFVRCWLKGLSTDQVWSQAVDGPGFEWIEVDKSAELPAAFSVSTNVAG